MSIFNSLDRQTLALTRKLLEGHAPAIIKTLPKDNYSRYSIDTGTVDAITAELDAVTVSQIINEITSIGQGWLNDTTNDSFAERQQIIAYLLKQWIGVGEDMTRLQNGDDNVDQQPSERQPQLH